MHSTEQHTIAVYKTKTNVTQASISPSVSFAFILEHHLPFFSAIAAARSHIRQRSSRIHRKWKIFIALKRERDQCKVNTLTTNSNGHSTAHTDVTKQANTLTILFSNCLSFFLLLFSGFCSFVYGISFHVCCVEWPLQLIVGSCEWKSDWFYSRRSETITDWNNIAKFNEKRKNQNKTGFLNWFKRNQSIQ